MSDWLVAIRGWHWAAIGLIAGLVVGFARDGMQTATPDDRLLDRYDVILTNAREFEAALTDQISSEHRRFEDLVVYPARSRARDGSRRYFVTGQYWNGRRERDEKGELVARYAAACFVTAGAYTPVATPSKSYPSVVGYLEDLRLQAKVQFQYAWWRPLTGGRILWPAGMTVALGLVWPTVINVGSPGTELEFAL